MEENPVTSRRWRTQSRILFISFSIINVAVGSQLLLAAPVRPFPRKVSLEKEIDKHLSMTDEHMNKQEICPKILLGNVIDTLKDFIFCHLENSRKG